MHGTVQGVGFRWWTRARALELGLVGYASNQRDGRVLVVAEGERGALDTLVGMLESSGTPGRVDRVVHTYDTPRGDLTGFVER
ncbi:acylphosphatase [Rhodococcus rhodnii LMG 5362]|uniref:acylphosphatase n=1 Tax=Rhodococcus rhodnii LMG 5362 TaxID=1273125 RepID=R7WKJ0_9NOCA|nr:acylphosphatase [Rhodococcus rhodnii LMG 5362]